jgi:NAD dependent epimerase/dehydratase family enzyme
MRVVIAGSSGLIGSALTVSLLADGHDVVRLVRRQPVPAAAEARATEAQWDPSAAHLPASALSGADAVVNLAGAGVGDHRWTAAYRQKIRDSRVLTTATLATAVADLSNPPRAFIAGSAKPATPRPTNLPRLARTSSPASARSGRRPRIRRARRASASCTPASA